MSSSMPVFASNDDEYLQAYEQHHQFKHLPKFTPMNAFESYFISRYTDIHLLHHLILLAQNATSITLSSTKGYPIETSSILQFELIGKQRSVLVFLETSYLPRQQASLRFWLLRSFVCKVFQSNKTIYVWGNHVEILRPFVHFNLFNRDQLDLPTFVNVEEAYGELNSCHLQSAIADLCNQFLDISHVFNRFSQGFDCIINECLAVTRIASILDKNFKFN